MNRPDPANTVDPRLDFADLPKLVQSWGQFRAEPSTLFGGGRQYRLFDADRWRRFRTALRPAD
jgi:hypothetical protein